MTRPTPRPRWAAALALAAALTGCGADVALQRDERLRFLTPPDGARVALPLVLRWSVDGFRGAGFDGSARGDRGVFAVFVDAAPMRPGRHLDTLADRDRACQTTVGCPDKAWLAERGIHLTRRAALALNGVSPTRGRPVRGGRRHEVTVVLLDGRGVRIGESAWTRSVVVPEDTR